MCQDLLHTRSGLHLLQSSSPGNWNLWSCSVIILIDLVFWGMLTIFNVILGFPPFWDVTRQATIIFHQPTSFLWTSLPATWRSLTPPSTLSSTVWLGHSSGMSSSKCLDWRSLTPPRKEYVRQYSYLVDMLYKNSYSAPSVLIKLEHSTTKTTLEKSHSILVTLTHGNKPYSTRAVSPMRQVSDTSVMTLMVEDMKNINLTISTSTSSSSDETHTPDTKL